MKVTREDTTVPWRGAEPDAVVLGELEVRAALPREIERVATLLKEEHYLAQLRHFLVQTA